MCKHKIMVTDAKITFCTLNMDLFKGNPINDYTQFTQRQTKFLHRPNKNEIYEKEI